MVRTAIPRVLTTLGATAVPQHKAAGSGAGRCRQPCANNKHLMRETLLAPGLPDNTGDWPCATMWQSSTESQGEAMMAPARKSRPALNGMRRLTPCGYTDCTVSSIEVVRRPSLKDASVDDGS
ncbi:hypothetical protein TcCL_ESM11655 [Trypanosoma cruzi]|nr:hypothetical protein TcCL_ESM11655 [Trypanosoma cruzi]